MATLALAYSFSYLGGAIGAGVGGSFAALSTGFAVGQVVGGVVGAIVDSTLLNMALAPSQSSQPGRVPETDIQTHTEGSPMTWLVGGDDVPITPTVVRASEPLGVRYKIKGSGKGGISGAGGDDGHTIKYFQDCMVHCGRLPAGVHRQRPDKNLCRLGRLFTRKEPAR